MKTIKVIALKQHVYDSVPRKAGEVYEAADGSVTALLLYGKVRLLDPATNPIDRNQYHRRDMRAKR